MPNCCMLMRMCAISKKRLKTCVAGFRKLCRQATRRKKQAFRPGTISNHRCMFRKWIAFCRSHQVQYINPSTATICAYIEFLAQRFTSYKAICNYVSAIKLLHNYTQEKLDNIQDFQVTIMLRATSLTLRNIPQRKQPLTIDHLFTLCNLCKTQGTTGAVIRLGLLLGYFGFLRASNICPPNRKAFDGTRHITRGDITVAPPGLVLALKWSKTMQVMNQPTKIPIPAMTCEVIDPVRAHQDMCEKIPAQPHRPLLILPDGNILTISQFRSYLKALLRGAGLSTKLYSAHSLRRGGATTTHKAGGRLH